MKRLPFVVMLGLAAATATITHNMHQIAQCEQWLMQLPAWYGMERDSQKSSVRYCQAQMADEVQLSQSTKQAIAAYMRDLNP
ncbi:MAG: hypothetical protein AAFY57_14465 [Cyanobacteria bacterium J06642_2]